MYSELTDHSSLLALLLFYVASDKPGVKFYLLS
jgi:hypothetical protein